MGYYVVWQLGRFSHIFDAEDGFCKKISGVGGFSVAIRSCEKKEFRRTVYWFFAYFLAESGLFHLQEVAFYVAFYWINFIIYQGFA